MSRTQLQLAYGTNAEIAAITPLDREVLVSSSDYSLTIGDGTTLGGKRRIPSGQAAPGYTKSTPTNGSTTTTVSMETMRILDHSSLIAGMTLVMPPSPVDGARFQVCFRSAVTTVTHNAGTGGATILGALTAATAGSGAAWVYQSSGNFWYRL